MFECLGEGLPADWLVIHGRRFVLPPRNRHPEEGEVDFLVLDPRRGLLALEVKGGPRSAGFPSAGAWCFPTWRRTATWGPSFRAGF